MSFLKDLIFGPAKRLPYDCYVRYGNGTSGHIPVWADDLRDAIRLVRDLMPEAEPAVSLTIELREPT